jgi:hypothetical protein
MALVANRDMEVAGWSLMMSFPPWNPCEASSPDPMCLRGALARGRHAQHRTGVSAARALDIYLILLFLI